MKAIQYTEYGSPDVLHLTEVEKPTPEANEVLVKIQAVHINFGDILARNFKAVSPSNFSMPAPLWLPSRLIFGFNKPRINILGNEFAGVVEAVGADVTLYKKGDAVFGYRGQSMGAYVEYLTMAEDGMIAPKPDNITFAEAATIPYGSLTALTLLRKVDIQRGQKVLINGASGGIGSYALQLAKHYGAEVTAVCGTPRIEMVKALGADHVIDYTQEDFTKNGEAYDLIFDVIRKTSFEACKNSLTENGRYFLASFKMKQLFQMLWITRNTSKKVICALSNETPADLKVIKDLIEAGAIKTVVDRCFPLEQTADGHRYMESGQKTGHVVVTVASAVGQA